MLRSAHIHEIRSFLVVARMAVAFALVFPIAASQTVSLASVVEAQTPGPTRKAIVFLQGVCSEVSANGQDGPFEPLKAELRQKGYNDDDDCLTFSYQGGTIDQATGRWNPRHYDPIDPISYALNWSVGKLHDEMLAFYRNHPRNQGKTFVLVGHSLGGVVATDGQGLPGADP